MKLTKQQLEEIQRNQIRFGVSLSAEELFTRIENMTPSGPPDPQFSTKEQNEAWLKARYG